MKPIVNAKGRSQVSWAARAGFSLVEVLVVLAIIASTAGFIAISILSALKQQNSRVCLTNMVTIEAAKDEYARDHPGATSVPSAREFAPYFRFGIPRCPDNGGTDYANLLDLGNPVFCSAHPENNGKLKISK
jgi:prepilin-type N-terminal cleavage/methylation domain-containing protein